MNKVMVLWVDLRSQRCGEGLCRSMPEAYQALEVKSPGAIQPAIASILPEFLCFEYDYPVREQREALRATRLRARGNAAPGPPFTASCCGAVPLGPPAASALNIRCTAWLPIARCKCTTPCG